MEKQIGENNTGIYKSLVDFREVLLESLDRFQDESNKEEINRLIHFMKGLKSVLDLNIQHVEVVENFEILKDMIISMSSGDFNKKIDLPNEHTLFCSYALLLNVLSEELESNVTKNHYLKETLTLLPEATIITDNKGVVKFSNEKAQALFNRDESNLFQLYVTNLFLSASKFGNSGIKEIVGGIEFKDALHIFGSNKTIVANIKVKPLTDMNGVRDGYIYTISPVNC